MSSTRIDRNLNEVAVSNSSKSSKMLTSRAESVVLVILEFLGFVIALYGLYYQYVSNTSVAGIIYCSFWYLASAISHALGLISISLESVEDEMKGDSQTILQFHYLVGWLSVMIGYPLLVTYTWMMLYPTNWAQAHLLLAIIPILFWVGQNRHWIVRSTQLCIGLTSISHFAICYLAGDVYGMSSVGVMTINIVALSTPTRYRICTFNSRELFGIGLVITSVLMHMSVINLKNPRYKVDFGAK